MKTTAGTRALFNRNVSGANATAKTSGISLHQLINKLLGNSMTMAFRNKSLVVNEIPEELMLANEKVTMAPVISDVLTAVISNSSNGHIYVTAEKFRDVITVQVQERNNNNGYALASSLRFIETEASAMGSHITIDGAQQRMVTISLSFPETEAVQYDC